MTAMRLQAVQLIGRFGDFGDGPNSFEDVVLNGVCMLLRDKLRLMKTLSLTGLRLKAMLFVFARRVR